MNETLCSIRSSVKEEKNIKAKPSQVPIGGVVALRQVSPDGCQSFWGEILQGCALLDRSLLCSVLQHRGWD